MIPVNSIEIPGPFRRICNDWAGDLGCMLRAVSSTGGLTTGTICPVRDYTDQEDRDHKWYYTIWCNLASDVGHALRLAGRDHEDYPTLRDFYDWADEQADRLSESYGLDEWDDLCE